MHKEVAAKGVGVEGADGIRLRPGDKRIVLTTDLLQPARTLTTGLITTPSLFYRCCFI